MQQRNKNNHGGFTLVETLVGLSIFVVSILALLSIIASGISDTGYAKKKIIAGYLAQEGIEYIRNMRDTYVLYDTNGGPQQGWNEFNTRLLVGSGCGEVDGCYPDDSSIDYRSDSQPMKALGLYPCGGEGCINLLYDPSTGKYGYPVPNPPITDSGFSRKITTEVISADETKVYSTVSWVQGSGTHSITFSEVLYNWVE